MAFGDMYIALRAGDFETFLVHLTTVQELIKVRARLREEATPRVHDDADKVNKCA